MVKNVSNYLEALSYDNKSVSNTKRLSQIPDSILSKLAEKERIEIKAKSFPKRKHFEDYFFNF